MQRSLGDVNSMLSAKGPFTFRTVRVLQGTKLIFGDLGQFRRCPANAVQSVGTFWVHCVSPGLSDGHRTGERHVH